jgi:hypothetical protein
MYLGTSPRHARSVALVLSLVTGYVLPQFHLKFDDFFETVQDAKSIPLSKWQVLARFITTKEKRSQTTVSSQGDKPTSSSSGPPSQPEDDPFEFNFVDPGGHEDVDDSQEPTRSDHPLEHREETIPDVPADTVQHQHPEATRRSSRQTVPTRRLIETAYVVLDDTDAVEDYETQTAAEDPIAFAVSKSDPDTLNFKDAMNTKDSISFKEAMIKEANAHTDIEHWEVWAKTDVPSNQDVLPAVWAFKRKRRIDTREVYKYKARA